MSCYTGKGWYMFAYWDYDDNNRNPGVLACSFVREVDMPGPGKAIPAGVQTRVRVHYSHYHTAKDTIGSLIANKSDMTTAIEALADLATLPPVNIGDSSK